MSGIDYEGPDYIPPRIAVFVGAMMRGPRTIGHSADFEDLFSPVPEERRTYIDGLSTIPVIFFSLFFAWVFIVVLMKCKGKEVGCASGLPFVSFRPEDNAPVDEEEEDYSRSDDGGNVIDPEKKSKDLENTADTIVSTSQSSDADTMSESSVKPLFLGTGGEMMECSTSDSNDDAKRCGTKLFCCFKRIKSEADDAEEVKINKSERRTRVAFLAFAAIAILGASLNLFFTFGPLREAVKVLTVESPDNLLSKYQNIVEEVETSLTTIEKLSVDAINLVETVPTNLTVICPAVKTTELESAIGVDIKDIVNTIIQQQYRLEDDIAAQISTRWSFLSEIEDGFFTIERYADEASKYIWILPGLLVAVGGLSFISIIGVILAWKERSGTRYQQVLSYVVLPLLFLVAMACWVAVMMFSLSTMVGTDICIAGSPFGSPDQTIQEILSIVGNETQGTAYQYASTYVNQCDGIAVPPTQDINDIKLEAQAHIDSIWRQISKVDSVGRTTALQKCGNTEEFMEMLSGARDLAMTLTDIRRALSSLEESIGCNSMHPIYIQLAHDVVCTQTLSASGYGFVTFLIMWICVMAMISMRASWLRSNIEDGRVYHDEAEIPENMVVDEHEEYLAYISRYKHEWQEYEGIEEDGVVNSPRSDYPEHPQSETAEDLDQNYHYDEDEDDELYKSDQSTLESSLYIEGMNQSGPQSIYQRQLTTNEIMNHLDDGVSYASGEISFASLTSAIQNDTGSLGNILSMPPPTNPDYKADKQQLLGAGGDHGEDDGDSDSDLIFETNFSHDLYAATDEVEVQLKDL